MVSSGRVLSALPQGGRPAQRTEPMLDLEVVPERSLGNEQWEFTLGECGILSRPLFAGPYFSLAPSASSFCPRYLAPVVLRLFVLLYLLFRLQALDTRSSHLCQCVFARGCLVLTLSC